MDKQELSATISIALLYIVRMLGLFMLLPVLPLLGDDISLATPFLIGLALGIYGLSQALLQIPMGLLSDRFGRKPIIFFGLLVFIAGSLVAVNATDIYGIILGRFLQGCGAISSTLLALLSDVTRVDNRSKAMAIVGMSIGASFGIALVIGPWINGIYGIDGIFLFTAAAGLLGIVVLLAFIPTPKSRGFNADAQLSLSRLNEVLRHGGLVRTTFGIFALHFLLMSSFIAFPQLMNGTGEIEVDSHHLVYFSILDITFVLMGPFMWLSDKPGLVKTMMQTMIGIFIVSQLLLSQSLGFYPVMIGMVLFFMAFNLLEVILPALVSKIAPAGSRGTAMGIYSTAQFAGAFFGGAIGGYIAGTWEISHLMYVNAAICVVWLVVGISMPHLGNVKSMTYSLAGFDDLSANQTLDALLSVDGVIEVVLIESEEVAYLKIDSDVLDTDALEILQQEQCEPLLEQT